jgi:hypothetical protein
MIKKKFVLTLFLLLFLFSLASRAFATVYVEPEMYFGFSDNSFLNFSSSQTFNTYYLEDNWWWFDSYGFNFVGLNGTVTSLYSSDTLAVSGTASGFSGSTHTIYIVCPYSVISSVSGGSIVYQNPSNNTFGFSVSGSFTLTVVFGTGYTTTTYSGTSTITETTTSSTSTWSETSTSTSTQTFTQTTSQTTVIFGETSATYYFRSDSRLTNGQFGYSLETENSALSNSFSVTHGGGSVTYGFDVFLAQYGNLTTLLGSKVAEITVSGVTEGYETAIWTCPERQLLVGYDAFMIVVNARVGSGAWQAKALYISPVLVSSKLLEQTWTFQLYVNYTATASDVHFGSSTFNSRIEGVGLREPTENEIQSFRWSQGDVIGMILGAYVDIIGPIFYVIVLLIVCVPLYVRHKNTGVIWVTFILMAVAGVIPWPILPSYIAAGIDAVLVLILAFLVWRVIR